MINVHDILETIKMIDEEYLDVRTITMGISLLDCCDSDIDKSCEKIYNKITRLAKNLVKTGEDIEREYGMRKAPRPSVTGYVQYDFPISCKTEAGSLYGRGIPVQSAGAAVCLGTVRNAEDGIGKRNLQISNVRK